MGNCRSIAGSIITILTLISCDTQFVVIPAVLTGEVEDIGRYQATVQASIIDIGPGISDHGHCYGTSKEPDIEGDRTSLGTADRIYQYSSLIGNLDPGETYFVRAYLISGNKVYYGEEVSFITAEEELEISSDEITEIMATSAKIKGTVLSDGGCQLSELGVLWNTEQTVSFDSYLGSNITVPSPGEFTIQISPLEPDREYFARVYVVACSDISYGDVLQFRTRDGIIIFGATFLTYLDSNSASCQSSITDDGGSQVISRGICWSESQHPTIYGNHEDAGSGTGIFECEISGLEAGHTYYLRAYATNEFQTFYGKEIKFQTAS